MSSNKVVFRPFSYPCKLKGCKNKKRNGRCSLNAVHFQIIDGRADYSKCLDYIVRSIEDLEEALR